MSTGENALAVQRPITPMDLIRDVVNAGGDPMQMATVIKELVALQQSQERFQWEREERQAKIDFDTALNECQGAIGRIAPNRARENGIKWLDYAQLDRELRPIYTKAGFSLTYSEEQGTGDRLRMKATLSRGGVHRDYFDGISRESPNAKMSRVDAEASASSRVKRYLLNKIFNVAIGIDLDERKPFERTMTDEAIAEWIEKFKTASPNRYVAVVGKSHDAAKDDNLAHLDLDCAALEFAPSLEALKAVFETAYRHWKKGILDGAKDKLLKVYSAAKVRLVQ